MTMIQIHQEALEGISPVFHEFLARYQSGHKSVYGFVEGKDDLSFYKGFINHAIPPEWQVDLWRAGNKDKVMAIHSCFDWDRFPIKQIAFFIDRDLADLMDYNSPDDINVYVTDNYSIENDVVNLETCDRLLTEVCNLTEITPDQKDQILALFEEEKKKFLEDLIPIMAWIIFWRKSGKSPCLNDILMKHLFAFAAGRIQTIENPKNENGALEYIHSQCSINFDTTVDISPVEQEFRADGNYLRFTRGKYLFWFLIEFALSVHRDINHIIPSITKSPKMNVSMSQTNGVVLIAPRARIPGSLKEFLQRTYCAYIEDVNWAA